MSGFDWRALLAVCGIVAAVFLLIHYQRRGEKSGGLWLSYSALSLELLGLSLSLYWAANAPDGAVLPIIFCIGWTGMVIGRRVSIPVLIEKARQGDWGIVAVSVAAILLAYTALYGSGLFHALNDSGTAAAARLEQSKPAQALDAEIDMTRQRLAGLAGFADAGKAAQVENQLQADAQARAAAAAQAAAAQQSRIAELQAALNAAQVAAAAYMQPDCTPKKDGRNQPYTSKAAAACEAVKAARAALNDAKYDRQADTPSAGGAGGDSYLSRHSEYNGLQQHLVSLQKQRAALSESGQGAVVQAWKPEDVALAEWFNTTPEQASRYKWLIATAIFDILGLLFYIASALYGAVESAAAAALRQFSALMAGGFEPEAAAAILAGGATPAAATPAAATPAAATPATATPAAATPATADMRLMSKLQGAGGMAFNTPLSNTPLSNTPLSNTPLSNTPLSNRKKGDIVKCSDCNDMITVKHKNHFRCNSCKANYERLYRIRYARK